MQQTQQTTTEQTQTEQNFFNSFSKQTQNSLKLADTFIKNKVISQNTYNQVVYNHILKNLGIDKI